MDYSDVYHTVGIFDDVLTADQIGKLQAYDHTAPQTIVPYEYYKETRSEEDLLFFFGDRSGFDTFANAREFEYNQGCNLTYYFDDIGKTLHTSDHDVFFKTVVEEAVAELSYQSENLSIVFLADESCIYQGQDMRNLTTCVRGIAKVTQNFKEYNEITVDESIRLGKLGINQLYKNGYTEYVDVDVHMSTVSSAKVNVHTIIPLCEAYN